MAAIVMHYGFDESGTFNFRNDGFDSSLVAAVACPDSILGPLEQCVKALRQEAGADELHAHVMATESKDLLLRTCGTLASFDICWRAVYTDTRVMPPAQQDHFRGRQVEAIEGGIAASVTLTQVQSAEAQQTLKRVRHATRVRVAEYLEFLVLFPRVVGDIIAASITAFQDESWAADFADLRFTSDAKLTGKLSMGEKTLNQALPRFLANDDRFTLPIPARWGPNHPFTANHSDPELGGITVPAVLGDGIDFVDSKSSVIVQVADVIAFVARSATDRPGDEVAQRCYRMLRRRGSCIDALETLSPVRIFSDRLGPDADPGWYEHLAA
jgi:hypothetical protein